MAATYQAQSKADVLSSLYIITRISQVCWGTSSQEKAPASLWVLPACLTLMLDSATVTGGGMRDNTSWCLGLQRRPLGGQCQKQE